MATSHRSRSRILTQFALPIAVILAAVVAFAVSAEAAPEYSYFPSADVTDGRFLAIVGDGMSTLARSSVTMSFSISEDAPSFLLGFFDGIGNSPWDYGSGANLPTNYQLYADPRGDGSGTELGWSGTDASMLGNAWQDFTIVTGDSARSASGNYFYRLTISSSSLVAQANNFKVRVEGKTYITPLETFGYMASLHPTVTEDYDGVWSFNFIVPQGADYLQVWDGDFDYGTSAASGDTDDPNTPNDIPVWASTAAVAEGAKGKGSPPDDNVDTPSKAVSPNDRYSLIKPDLTSFANLDPSGEREWEIFRVDTAPFDASVMDYRTDSLPAGTYTLQAVGVDWQNLNALRFEHPVVGVNFAGEPIEPEFPYLIGDTVWLDLDADGLKDSTEDGIPGVVVTLRDSQGSLLATTITDSQGHYQFSVLPGSYLVDIVDAANTDPGGPLADLVQPDRVVQTAVVQHNPCVVTARCVRRHTPCS
jgi:hypothetical protein